MPTKTDAERLAEAETAMRDALEAGKAARLPSAQAAHDLLHSAAVTKLLDQARALAESSIDDVTRQPGQPGPEGTKASLDRVIQALDLGRKLTATRVEALKPAAEQPAQTEA